MGKKLFKFKIWTTRLLTKISIYHEIVKKFDICIKSAFFFYSICFERDRPTSSALYILWQENNYLVFQKIYF